MVGEAAMLPAVAVTITRHTHICLPLTHVQASIVGSTARCKRQQLPRGCEQLNVLRDKLVARVIRRHNDDGVLCRDMRAAVGGAVRACEGEGVGQCNNQRQQPKDLISHAHVCVCTHTCIHVFPRTVRTCGVWSIASMRRGRASVTQW